MARTPTTPSLPFQGNTLTSRHCSAQAAISAADTRVWKSAQYLTWLLEVGGATDHGAALHFDWPLSSICSIRNGLVDRGLVEVGGTSMGRYGKTVTVWQPTVLARHEAGASKDWRVSA